MSSKVRYLQCLALSVIVFITAFLLVTVLWSISVGSAQPSVMAIDRDYLMSLNHSTRNISTELHKSLKTLGLLRNTQNGPFHQGVYRGCRAGKNKQRSINVRITDRASQAFSHSKSGVNTNNLVTVLRKPSPAKNNQFRFGYMNAQSVGNKSHTICDFIHSNNISICGISETWLKPGDNVIETECTPTGYNILSTYRPHHNGGGTSIIYKQSFKVIHYPSDDSKRSYEYTEVQLSASGVVATKC